MILEHVEVCDACGNRTFSQVTTRGDGYCVDECDTCGLAWVDPRPTGASLLEFYGTGYFSGAAKGIGYANYASEARDAVLAIATERFRLLQRYSDLRTAAVLEIGSATGEFCSLAADVADQVVGADLSADAIEIARQRYDRIEFIQGGSDVLIGRGAQFDAVCAFDVIEHVASPTEFLMNIRRLLAPHGVAILSTPNYDHYLTHVAGHAKRRWAGFEHSFEHLYFMSPATLSLLTQKSGLEVVDWFTSGDGIIRLGVMSRFSRGAKSTIRAAAKVCGILSLVRKWRSRRQAPRPLEVEGTGHTLTMVLSVKR